MANIIHIPQFWAKVDTIFGTTAPDIQGIKEILTVLQYTTAESIIKFSKQSEVRTIELEFTNKKTELVAKYPQLNEFSFHSGFYSNLSLIATKIKNHYIRELDINLETTTNKVLEDGKKVWFFSLHF